MWFRAGFILSLLLLWPEAARAVVSEDALPHQAEWVSAPGDFTTPDRAWFRRGFQCGSKLVKAILLATADERAEIYLNGSRAVEVIGFERAITVDVTTLVRAGSTNILAVAARHTAGQTAFRLMLELAFADGKQRWVVSDRGWAASRTEARGWLDASFRAADWQPAFAHGKAGLEKWGNPFHAMKSVDAYNSWMLAREADRATDPATISSPPGFRVEMIRSAEPGEDSWVALAFDPQGRATLACEKKGLLRLTLGGPDQSSVERVEQIDSSLLECRGLLYAHDSLYVNANNSKGFYRLRDTDGDGVFEERKLLLETEGGVGHGRNHLALGPDGLIYLAHGDDVQLPRQLDTNSPLRQMASDQLLPHPSSSQAARRYAQVGHVLQTDRDGSFFRLFAGGLRNPMDIAFNEAGELFTYDADMERDIGAPWYHPTRVLHLVPGGDYGWRRSAPNLPAYAPDTLPAAIDIGVGSPTGVGFGTGSHFPEKYRRAFYIADWAYGRIVAAHLQPAGASYAGETETFLSGRPLNVTDFVFGPDGAMYFVTGGRGTKSGLYRVSYPASEASTAQDQKPHHDSAAVALRAIRRKIEQLRYEPDPSLSSASNVVEQIWPFLGHADRWIRSAARNALERQAPEEWSSRALAETNSRMAFAALLALGRVTTTNTQAALLARCGKLLERTFNETELLELLRIVSLRVARFGQEPTMAAKFIPQLERRYPASSRALNHELCRLLSVLRSSNVVAKTCALLSAARLPADLLHYTMFLAPINQGWTLEQRQAFLDALRRAEQEQGGSDYYRAIRAARQTAVAQLTAEEREQLAAWLAPSQPVPFTIGAPPPTRPFVRDWKMEDFDSEKNPPPPNVENGRRAFQEACAACHRFGAEGGVFGPDLTSVAARFGRRDLLETILNPSKAIDEKYRGITLTLANGEAITGLLDNEDDRSVVIAAGALGEIPAEIQKRDIIARRLSEISPMPTGLLNGFTREEIIDLLAFLESAFATPSPP